MTKELTELEAEMLAMLETCLNAMSELMNHQEGWEEDYQKLQDLIKKKQIMEEQKYAVVYFEGVHPYLTSGKPYKLKLREMECYNVIDDDKDGICISTDGYCAHLIGEGVNARFEIKTLHEIYMEQRESVDGRCPQCGEDEAITTGEQTFAGTRDEPAEYKLECHKCGHAVYETDWEDGYETFEEWQERTGYYDEE